MTVQVLVGPAGSGKTGRSLEILKRFTPLEHQNSVRLIVPTFPQVLQLRRFLLSDPDFPGMLGNPICTFYQFALDVLPETASPKRISDTQRLLVLREAISRGAPGYFDLVRDFPNFPDALASTIRSLRSSAVAPEDLRVAVESAGDGLPESSRRKLLDLADLYRSYLDALSVSRACDPEEALSLALEVARKEPDQLRRFKCVILDGFQAFTPVQEELIRLAAEYSGQVVITVEYESNRPKIFTYIEPFLSFATSLPDASAEHLQGRGDSGSALCHLRANLFADGTPSMIDPDESLTVLAGATPGTEVELIAEEIKKLVRDEGYQYSDFGIVGRGIDPYRHQIEPLFRAYRIPLGEEDRSLASNPLARALVLCLRVTRGSWRQADVLAALKSGYLRCSTEAWIEIARAAEAVGISGRDAWLGQWDTGDEMLASSVRALSPVAALDDVSGSHGAARFRSAVEELVKSFDWRESEDDGTAWRSIRRIMGDVASGEAFLQRKLTFGEFADLLELRINRVTYRFPGRSNGVSVFGVNSLCGRKFRAVFIVGALRGVFPRQVREDPFLLDFERAILNPYLSHTLDLRTAVRRRERYLFYSAVCSATERLYLCYPKSNASGQDCSPSPYLEKVDELFSQRAPRIVRDYPEVLPAVERVETEEQLVARVVLGCSSEKAGGEGIAATAYNLLLEAGLMGPGAFEWLGEDPSGDRIPARVRRLLCGNVTEEDNPFTE